jgi:hypothetical protein
VIILPVALIWLGRRQHQKEWPKTGTAALLISALSTALLLYYNHSRTGTYFYVLETTRGLFPGNLKYLPPLVWMSMVNINFPLTQLSLKTDFSYAFFMNWLKLTNVFLMVALVYYLLKTFRIQNLPNKRSAPGYFFTLSGILSAGTVASLALLSITRSRTFRIDEQWTYIEEHRYMLLVTVTIMLFLVYDFFVRNRHRISWPWKILRMLIMFIMINETAHGIWIIARKPIQPYGDAALLYGNPETTKFVQKKLDETKQEDSELILMDEDYNLRGFGLLKGISIIDEPKEVKIISADNSNRKKILFRLRPGHEPLYPFFANRGVTYCGVADRYRFYELNLP